MTQSSNGFLCGQDFVTYGAMLAFGLACSFAGSSNSSVNDFGVTGSGQNFVVLFYLADTTLAVCSIAGFGAGGLLTFEFGPVVTQSGNFSLSNQNFSAYGAVLAFGQAGFGAGSSNSSINNFGVTQSRDSFLTFVVLATRALLVSSVTVFGAGSSKSICVNQIVTQSFYNERPLNSLIFAAVITYDKSTSSTGFGAGSRD